MSEELELQITEDGSPTLYSTQFQECYHSMRGALSESKHICIDNGLSTLTCEPPIRILEYGFGLGMNLWVAIQWAIQNAKTIDYTTLELYPVPLEMVSLVRCLEPSEVEILWREAHKTPWEISCSLLFSLMPLARFAYQNNGEVNCLQEFLMPYFLEDAWLPTVPAEK